MDVKKGPGQPKKLDAKKNISFRLHPVTIEYLKTKQNMVSYIEKLILDDITRLK